MFFGGVPSINPDGTIAVTYGGALSGMEEKSRRREQDVADAAAADSNGYHDDDDYLDGRTQKNRWSTSGYDPDDTRYPKFILQLMKHPPSFGAATRIHLYTHSTSAPKQVGEYANAQNRLLLLAEDDRARFQEATGIDFGGTYVPDMIFQMNTVRGFLWTPSLDPGAAIYSGGESVYDDELVHKMCHCPPSFTLALSLHESSVELARLNPKRARDYAQAAKTVAIMEEHASDGLLLERLNASKGAH